MTATILVGDCRQTLKTLPDQSVHCVVTSPPYWGLRSYKGDSGMIGLEPTWEQHMDNLLEVFDQVWRVLRDDGTLWLNYGDAYDKKQLMLMPTKIALAMQKRGWILRSEIVWAKKNCMPEPVKDRPTTSHEKLLLFTKSLKYFYDHVAVRTPAKESSIKRVESGWNHNPPDDQGHRIPPLTTEKMGERFCPDGQANLRNVWHIPTSGYKEAHFATFPVKLVEPCIKAGTPKPAIVLDPFGGSGTVSIVAERLGRDSIICEISPEYADLAHKRIESESLPMFPTEIKLINNDKLV